MKAFKRLLSILVVLATFVGMGVGAASPAHAVATSALTMLQASAGSRPPAHSLALGTLPSSTDIHVDVTLKLPDPMAVTSFIASLADRRSPNFHHFLRPGQFGRLFGAPLSEVNAVEATLGADGLHPGSVASDRLSIPVTAPASEIDCAFHVSLVDYRLPSGRAAFTTLSPPSIATSVSSYVEGIVGLSDLYLPQSSLVGAGVSREAAPRSPADLHPMTAGPTPCAAASGANKYGLLTADQLASYYGMTPLYSLGDFGQGVNVALVELQPNLPSDIAAYQACYGTHTTINYIDVDGGAGSGAGGGGGRGGGEAALDIENVIGLAPEATIDVYRAPPTELYDDFSAIVNADKDQVISTSNGLCEQDEGLSTVTSQTAVFEQAATQGQSVFAAAGDEGSTACYTTQGTTPGSTLAVLDPASQPYVLGVGGTTIGATSETVWNDSSNSDGAGGGGVSAVVCMPSYQDQSGIQGVISSYSVRDSASCGATTGYLREVPDLSADADPATGYVTYWNGSWYYEQDPNYPAQGYASGGTSAAAPLWAAVTALVDSSPVCKAYGSESAVQATGLYDAVSKGLVPSAFHDVTSGNNDYTPSGYTGGLYPATKGYDMASGIGTPDASMLVSLLCGSSATAPTVTGVSPTSGPSAGGTSVTITGTGFTTATKVDFGTARVAGIRVVSPTSITATSPPESVGLVNVTVTTLAGTSVTSTADRFSYKSALATTATSFITSTNRVTYGHEQVEHLSVTVSPQYSDTMASGMVTIRESTTSLCLIRLSSGKGSCKLSPEELHAGIDQLVAIYDGNKSFKGSTSFKEILTVARATSTAALKLSATKVAYGTEQAERISVTVSPEYSGAKVTGTVIIKESTTRLCLIALSSGKGSCRLSPKRLHAGIDQLVAIYGGSANYEGSASADKTLTVAK